MFKCQINHSLWFERTITQWSIFPTQGSNAPGIGRWILNNCATREVPLTNSLNLLLFVKSLRTLRLLGTYCESPQFLKLLVPVLCKFLFFNQLAHLGNMACYRLITYKEDTLIAQNSSVGDKKIKLNLFFWWYIMWKLSIY